MPVAIENTFIPPIFAIHICCWNPALFTVSSYIKLLVVEADPEITVFLLGYDKAMRPISGFSNICNNFSAFKILKILFEQFQPGAGMLVSNDESLEAHWDPA